MVDVIGLEHSVLATQHGVFTYGVTGQCTSCLLGRVLC